MLTIAFADVFRIVADDSPPPSDASNGTCSGLDCWTQTTLGKVGLCLIGIGFVCASLSQLVPGFTGRFKRELDPRKIAQRRWERMAVYVLGHVGILSRALVFLACAVLFFRSVAIVGYMRLTRSTPVNYLNVCFSIHSGLQR